MRWCKAVIPAPKVVAPKPVRFWFHCQHAIPLIHHNLTGLLAPWPHAVTEIYLSREGSVGLAQWLGTLLTVSLLRYWPQAQQSIIQTFIKPQFMLPERILASLTLTSPSFWPFCNLVFFYMRQKMNVWVKPSFCLIKKGLSWAQWL